METEELESKKGDHGCMAVLGDEYCKRKREFERRKLVTCLVVLTQRALSNKGDRGKFEHQNLA